MKRYEIEEVDLKGKEYIAAIVIAKAESIENVRRAIEMHKNCPEYFALFPFEGLPKFAIICVTRKTKEWWIKLLEEKPGYVFATECKVWIINPEIYPDKVPFKIPVELSEISPCGKSCINCPGYKKVCDGCRATTLYLGKR